MPTPSYLTADDVTANVAVGFDLEPYINEADGEIQDIAERLGIRSPDDSIQTNPLHYKIKRYGIAYILMRLCQDKAGSNNSEVSDNEKYLNLYTMYRREVESLRPQLSYEMFIGNISAIRDRSTVSGTIFRS